MSNYRNVETLTADGNTTAVTVNGWVTCVAIGDFGSGTVTWQFNGDGTWRSIYAGTSNTTEQTYTANHMVNFYFGDEVKIRCNLGSSTSPDLDVQLLSNPCNRG